MPPKKTTNKSSVETKQPTTPLRYKYGSSGILPKKITKNRHDTQQPSSSQHGASGSSEVSTETTKQIHETHQPCSSQQGASGTSEIFPKESAKTPRNLANRYEIVLKLEKGNSGTVYLCKDLRCHAEDPCEHLKVLKKIRQSGFESDETVEGMHEARLLSKLNHPGIVLLHDSFVDGDFFCMVTEYCGGGNMHEVIRKSEESGRPFDEGAVMDWFVQLLTALHYMHTQQVLHRNLQTWKIYLKQNRLKIGGFGKCKVWMDKNDMASTLVESAMYMSPEMIQGLGYNFKADIWALGCILYEICALKYAYSGNTLMAMLYRIVEGDPPNLPENYHKEMNRILHLMLTKEPEKRPTTEELMKIPHISDYIRAAVPKQTEGEGKSSSSEHVGRDSQRLNKLATGVEEQTEDDRAETEVDDEKTIIGELSAEFNAKLNKDFPEEDNPVLSGGET